MNNTRPSLSVLIPVMLTFFTMGFVDLVGIATNYVKSDFTLTDTMANLLPSMVFIWFLIFSVPTGLLMNRIGRRNTVLISIVVTFVSLLVPFLGYSYPIMLISFALLGIGNTIMQVSLNPLLANIVSGKMMASTLTLGQFFKAIASFIAPILAAWAAARFGDWKMLYIIFAIVSLLSMVWLYFTKVKEEAPVGKTTSVRQCFSLLGDGMVLMLFLGIMCHVGLDVGINTTAPKLLMERAGLPLAAAGYATSLYFLCRTVGCFSGAFILAHFSPKKFFAISAACLVLSVVGLLFFSNTIMIYICIGVLGFGNSNVFPIIFSQALEREPKHTNEVSGLMMMGIFGGAIIPLLMGVASDAVGAQFGAIVVAMVCAAYLMALATKLK